MGSVVLSRSVCEYVFIGNNNSQFLFWGRTINDLSSLHALHSLSLPQPLSSLPPPPAAALSPYAYDNTTHIYTHSFQKGNSRTENASQKLISKGAFIAFSTPKIFERDACLGIYFSYSSMRTKFPSWQIIIARTHFVKCHSLVKWMCNQMQTKHSFREAEDTLHLKIRNSFEIQI